MVDAIGPEKVIFTAAPWCSMRGALDVHVNAAPSKTDTEQRNATTVQRK
jgi:hypothetical protein